MKKLKIIILAFSLTGMLFFSSCNEAEKPKTLNKSFGWSHGEVNIESDGAHVLSADEIVPLKQDLYEKLEKDGYLISEYGKAPDSDIAADRIYAEKDGKFIDICYGLSVEQAEEIFKNYESSYNDYFLLAQNEGYVYIVSDEETFKTAGFETLETNGILYIWE